MITEICSIYTRAGLTGRQAVILTIAFNESELAHKTQAGYSAALRQCHGIGSKSAEKRLKLKGVFCCNEKEAKTIEIGYSMYSIRWLKLNLIYCAADTEGKEDRRVFVIGEVSQRLGPLQQKILEMRGGKTDAMFKTIRTDPDQFVFGDVKALSQIQVKHMCQRIK